MKKTFALVTMLSLLVGFPGIATAQDVSGQTEAIVEVTAEDLGATTAEINNATSEEAVPVTETGTLVEIGNTTADETTVIVRVTEPDGTTEDKTVEIAQEATTVVAGDGSDTELSDWIAGDQITVQAEENTNSGSIRAKKVINRAIHRRLRGQNGWITAIRADENEIDVSWQNKVYTLNVANARMVAGVKSSATINDLKVGDRIRARVEADGDGSELTWNAKIVVVLRRGKALFMRVTRWVVQGEIVSIDENPTIPTTITVKILKSRFHEEGDVNNLIGSPGDTLDVSITDQTNVRRRYFGKALITEFSEGDRVQVIGRLNESTGKLDAKVVRNASIQKLGVAHIVSTVASVDTTNNTLQAKPRSSETTWTVKLASGAKVRKSGEEITLSDVHVGDKIRVSGVANRKTKTVEAKQVVVLVPREVVKEKLKEMKGVLQNLR